MGESSIFQATVMYIEIKLFLFNMECNKQVKTLTCFMSFWYANEFQLVGGRVRLGMSTNSEAGHWTSLSSESNTMFSRKHWTAWLLKSRSWDKGWITKIEMIRTLILFKY